jgi:MFS family permease
VTSAVRQSLDSAVQRRVLWVLASGQVLGGLGMGAAISLGSLLVVQVSRNTAFAGFSSSMFTLGTAFAAIPLARLALRSGRRVALTTGTLLAAVGAVGVIIAAGIGSVPALLVSIILVGTGSAAGLQSRFAATDLANPERRARDLSLVVWATAIGVVIGPNLAGPGDLLGLELGLPELTGAFAITALAQLASGIIFMVFLRPDPLELSGGLGSANPTNKRGIGHAIRLLSTNVPAAAAVFVLAMSHAIMVAVMAMTPVHLSHLGVSVTVIGFTISLHTAGMYLFAPVFGWFADRVGRRSVILFGQALYLASLLINGFLAESVVAVTVSMVLLGLGWSASTVAASAGITDSIAPADKTTVQGFSDSVMSFAGAGGGLVAGVILAAVGYGLLSILVIALVVAASLAALLTRGRATTT